MYPTIKKTNEKIKTFNVSLEFDGFLIKIKNREPAQKKAKMLHPVIIA